MSRLAPQSVTSAQRKLSRAVEQVRTLLEEADAYKRGHAYEFRPHFERMSQSEILCRCYASEREPPPEHWPLLAGEAVHNLRSALDNAIWASWSAVAGNTGDGRHTQFTIADTSEDFERWSRRQLDGVPSAVRGTVERAQPYVRWPSEPSREFLAVLRDFSNTDKHRNLAVVAAAVSFEMVGVGTNVVAEKWHYASGKRLGPGEKEISSFVARKTDGTTIEEADVQPDFLYAVEVESVPLDFLKGIVHNVFEVLTEIETGVRPSPSARYPI